MAPLHGLMGELTTWRIDSIVQMMEKSRDEGRILGFVRGLRLSAQLIYVLRTCLSSTDLEVDWGHILDANEDYCSAECDIIVHRGGCVAQWNGSDRPVMDFKFIGCQSAVAVVSCKSFMTRVDQKYCEKMRPYVDKVFIFAECCEKGKAENLRDSAVKAGYGGLWCLYEWDRETSDVVEDQTGWEEFLDTIENVASQA